MYMTSWKAYRMPGNVMRVETSAGGLSPESAELLRSAYDSMLSAVGDLAKAATR